MRPTLQGCKIILKSILIIFLRYKYHYIWINLNRKIIFCNLNNLDSINNIIYYIKNIHYYDNLLFRIKNNIIYIDL